MQMIQGVLSVPRKMTVHSLCGENLVMSGTNATRK
jgi:hypothetical protein